MVNLGLLEMRELNMPEAKKWIMRAAEKGNHNANELADKYNLRDSPCRDVDPEVYRYSFVFTSLSHMCFHRSRST